MDNTISISVETSGRIGSVAVARGPVLLASRSFHTQHHHGVELLPTVSNLCEQADIKPDMIQHVYVSGGPGSFTGLRIGITFAKAMAFAADAKVVRVPTLDVIAQNALELPTPPPRVTVILDAKRRHLYCATFELSTDAYTPVDEPAERDPLTYLPSCGDIAAMGEGIAFHREAVEVARNVTVLSEELNRARAEIVHKRGRRMAAENRFIPIGKLVPIYIRRPEAEEKWEQRHGQSH